MLKLAGLTPLVSTASVFRHVLSLCCESLIRGSRGALGAGGNSWSRGSGGLSAQGSRCCSLFHCSPYGPAVLGPWGPVSAAPPRPGPCHQTPLVSCLTPALGPTSTFLPYVDTTPTKVVLFWGFFVRHLLCNVGFHITMNLFLKLFLPQ